MRKVEMSWVVAVGSHKNWGVKEKILLVTMVQLVV